MENMKVPELKALAKEQGLKRYSKLRKAELIALLIVQVPAPCTRPPPPPPNRQELEEKQSTTRQIMRRQNKTNKLNKQIKSPERELESLRSERDSIINNIEGVQKFKSQ